MFNLSLGFGVGFVMISLFLLRRWKIWTLYFLVGGIGAAVLLSYVVHTTPLESYYRYFLSLVVNQVLLTPAWLQVFPETGMFLMQSGGNWTAFQLSFECLGFIELFIFGGLMAFYPVFSTREKLITLLEGSILIFVVNLARLVIIILLVAKAGISYTFVTHAIIARVFFFTLVIGIYWHFFTIKTIQKFKELGVRE